MVLDAGGGGGGGTLGIEVPTGDPGALHAGAAALRGMSGVLDRTASALENGTPLGWSGSAAMTFTDLCGTESLAASRGAAAMELGARVLQNLADDLRAAQRAVKAQVEAAQEAKASADKARLAAERAADRATAQRLSAAASAKRASAAEANGLPASAERTAQQNALTGASQADEERVRHERAASNADERLGDAQRRGRQLAERYEETARQAARMLAGLSNQAPVVTAINGTPVAATGGPGEPPAVEPVTVTASPAPKPEEEEDDGGGLLGNIVHGALDVGGLVPVLGAPADGLNAIIYEVEGDHVNAGLSAAGMIPIAGEIATGGKLIGKGAKAIEGATDAERAVDTATDAGKAADATTATPPTRPTWRQSEEDVLSQLGPQYSRQKSFLNGKAEDYGVTGTVRPEAWKPGESVEVKNYNVQSSSGRSNLVRNIAGQVEQRVTHLPPDTTQRIVIDVRGQDVTSEMLEKLGARIERKTGGVVGPDQISFLRSHP